MAKRRRAISYTVSLDRDLVKRFRAACKRRDIEQSRAVTRMLKYFLAHRYAFGNGLRRPVRRKKKTIDLG
jgi:hypothetical protein